MNVLFACIHNAGRSQMAAHFFNTLAPAHLSALSAGTRPAAAVHPQVVEVMRETGFDLSAVRPRKLTAQVASAADLLVTMGCGEQCPHVQGLRRLDWALADPKDGSLDAVRGIRDDIHARVTALVDTLTSAP